MDNEERGAPRYKLFVPLLMFVFLAGIFFSVLQDKDYDPNALPSALVGKSFPEFSLNDLVTGEKLDRATVTGKPMLVNLWATWCISCKVEHPFLNKLQQEGVRIIGINYKDDPEQARQWLKDLGNPYRVVIQDQEGTLGLNLGVYGAPETYFVDGNGKIVYRHVGVIDSRNWSEKLAAVYHQMQGH